MERNYWSRTFSRRLTRRRAITATGTMAAGAAFLIACGGDDEEPAAGGGTEATGATGGGAAGGTGGGTSGLLTQPTYVGPAEAKRGGVFKSFLQGSFDSFDPMSGQRGLNDVADKVMSSLFTEVPGKLENSGHELQGDLVDSWEIAPDGMHATIKLRRGAKWHNVDPVNGREFDSEDVVASFDRYKEFGNLGSSIFRERGPGGFVSSYSASDASTVVVDFAQPLAWALSWFAPFGGYTSTLMIIPKETDNGFDGDQKMIGTGPFYVEDYQSSVGVTLLRNTEYWDPDWALVDEIQMPIVPEYSALQAQLKAGAIHFTTNDPARIVRATDMLVTMKDQPELLLYQGPRDVGTSVITFGTQTNIGGKNPYADERVRQAFSRAYDRELDNDVQYNIKEFEDAGLPVESFWNSHLAQRPDYAGGGWALDPRDEEFGENAEFFQYNLEEAKKLLSAAGYEDGFEVEFRYPHAPAYDQQTRVEPLFFYLQDLGLTVKQVAMTDYTQDYIPNNRDASGQYPGIGYHSVTGGIPSAVDPTAAIVAEHHPNAGVTFHGYNDGKGDPDLVAILEKAMVEQDAEARKALNHEAQRYLGRAMWNLIEAGGATSFVAAWPAVGNYRVWNASPSTWRYYQLFIDDSKAPHA